MTQLMALAASVMTLASGPDGIECYPAHITGYVRSEYGPVTADGTPIWTREPIAASAPDLPFNSMVEVEGLGTYRIADRGLLGAAGWIDIAVDTRAEAYAITGTRMICVTPPR